MDHLLNCKQLKSVFYKFYQTSILEIIMVITQRSMEVGTCYHRRLWFLSSERLPHKGLIVHFSLVSLGDCCFWVQSECWRKFCWVPPPLLISFCILSLHLFSSSSSLLPASCVGMVLFHAVGGMWMVLCLIWDSLKLQIFRWFFAFWKRVHNQYVRHSTVSLFS